MSTEIKVKQSEIEQALTQMKSSSEALNSSFPSSIGNGNRLDVVNKLNEINRTLEQLTENYKALLLHNEEMTRQSVGQMVEKDQQLSSNMQIR
ncbi:YwqI/YxiC family protein [Sutcliffiella horikoshii]|uniref:YwqI/YxiC family protein n=1 Tax=Sutcliffiella horikoshii TaxID=79883 RepID=UPI0007D06C22|nr:YwqI/YxiC family protein [Sutcliffiella horikoshii]MCM3618164.1 YwqI/YxiC family protein [Sutcliffiella horikoshii]